jgi:glycosyltransferase involved in cell wall biosynthesis
LKLHPFNLKRRLIAHKYRKGEFDQVIAACEQLLEGNPNEVFALELMARAHISSRNWDAGRRLLEQLFAIDAGHSDVSFQLARCSIYTKHWANLNLIARHDSTALKVDSITQALAKKLLSLSDTEFIDFATEQELEETLPESALSRWANIDFSIRPHRILAIDRYCLDRAIGGTYFGHLIDLTMNRSVSEAKNTFDFFISQHPISSICVWLGPGIEMRTQHSLTITEWLISYINPSEVTLQTLEAVCTSESMPPHIERFVSEFIEICSEEELKAAIRVIGMKSDPRNFVNEDVIVQMLADEGDPSSENPRVHRWMIEHCLRTDNVELIKKMCKNNPKGIALPLINTLQNLSNNRYDKRLVDLLEVILNEPSMIEEIHMRQEISKAILAAFEPLLAFAFAYECVQLEPQDAVCGLHMLEAAINTGSPSLILQSADIVLSMKHRSSKIDYANIAIAAIRHGDVEYAKSLLIENRLASDTRSQRIRVGIPFHIEGDYELAIEEIKKTQNKHLSDPTLHLYEALSLIGLKRFQEAIHFANSKVTDRVNRALLLHMAYRSAGQEELAKSVFDELMDLQNRKRIPYRFFSHQYDFMELEAESVIQDDVSESQCLVSVIMTVHKWNDAFPLAVNSILNQSHQNIELIVVDDCSPRTDVEQYDAFLLDSRIKRIRMDQNSGTYACRNRGLSVARGEFITFADSDDWNHPDRISQSVLFSRQKDADVVMGRFLRMNKQGEIQFNGSKLSQFCLVGIFIRKQVIENFDLRFDERARFSADSEFFERLTILLGNRRIYRHEGIDVFALHHDDSLTGGGLNAIDWMGPGETRLRYVNGYRRAHGKLVLDKDSFNFNHFPEPSADLIQDTKNVHDLMLRSVLGMERLERAIGQSHSVDENITVFMATYPGGFKTVADAVQSLLNQTKKIDRIVIHVNSTKPPDTLPNDSRIDVRLSEENHADNGKFKYMQEFDGYFLTVDDDISYPTDYVEKMIEYVDRFEKKSIIGVHGAVLPVGPPLTRWAEYRELRRTHTFMSANSSFTKVNCLGTGTIAFHSQIGTPDFKDLDTLRMVDLHIAVWAQKNDISMYSCPRKKEWLSEFEIEHEQRIWSQANTEQDLQAKMLLTLNKIPFWNHLNQFTFKLQHGPLSMINQWTNRQIPFGMRLPNHIDWPDLPDLPKVTIYIPAFNTEKYIAQCVDSAINQTYPNTEISIQNGGSSDSTLSILTSKYSNHSDVILSSRPTTIGEGTNIAIGQGSGDLILQLDSDDVLHPNAVERLVSAIGKNNVCAYGNFQRIDEFGKVIDEGWEEAIYSRERLTRSMIIHHPRLFRRDAWEHVGGHDEKLRNAEDYDFFLRLSEVGNMVHLRETLYSYRVLEGSASNFSSDVLTANTHLVQRRMLLRNKINYEIIIPNLDQPRHIRYRHIAYSED